MAEQAKQARELYKQGYNCAQAVFAAFCRDMDMDFETALKITSSFGGGMGRLREVCGAVSGMFAVAGIKYGYTDPKNSKARSEHYKLIRDLAEQFKSENNSIICKELIDPNIKFDKSVSENESKNPYKKPSCDDLVECAARIMSELIEKNEMEKCKMKIALPIESKSSDIPVCPSFGRAAFFAIYDTETKTYEFIKNEAAESQGGAGIKAAQALADNKINVLITFRCGQNAAEVLNNADIKMYKAENGSVADNIAKFNDKKLSVLTDIHAGYHNHGENK